ncbi:MAG: retroviral-like aspartic protease family protein [Acetobacteraceae bacterium]|jgi:predicted aspartyl protease
MTIARHWIACVLLLLVSACETNPINCDLVVVTRIPLEVHNRLLLVPAGIDGKWITLLVDSGSERTVLSEEVVNRLGLERDQKTVTRSLGVGGTYVANDAIIPGLVLGGVRFPITRISVGQLQFGPGLVADGLLGSDVLLAFDLDLDVPRRTLTLYRPRQCPDVEPPWDEPFARVPGVTALRDRLLIPIELDGVDGMGILDTGAQATTIGLRMAERLGLTPASMSSDPVVQHHGAGPGSQEARLHRFSFLRIGPAVSANPVLSVLPVDAGVGDALVGEDFINGRRIWLSFANREVFIATSRPGPVRESGDR